MIILTHTPDEKKADIINIDFFKKVTINVLEPQERNKINYKRRILTTRFTKKLYPITKELTHKDHGGHKELV